MGSHWVPSRRGPAPTAPYEYNALVTRVIDGDTIACDVDLGFNTWLRGTFRLVGINAIELHQPGGKEARTNLATLLTASPDVVLTSVKDDKYGGRYGAIVTLTDGTDLAVHLVETGWAAPWTGAGSKPLPPWPREF